MKHAYLLDRHRPIQRPLQTRRGVAAGATVITAGIAITGLVQGLLAARHATAPSELLTVDYGIQLATLLAVLLVAAARVDDSILGLSLSVFAASMFLPVMHEHAATLPLAGIAYLINCAAVTILAATTVRRMRLRRRQSKPNTPIWA